MIIQIYCKNRQDKIQNGYIGEAMKLASGEDKVIENRLQSFGDV